MDRDPMLSLPWVPVKNGTGSLIPAFGLVKLVASADGVRTVSAPTTDDDPWCYVNSSAALRSPSGRGIARFQLTGEVAYDPTDGTPAVGEEWGPKAGTHLAKKGFKGLRVAGEPNGTTVVMDRVDPAGAVCGPGYFLQMIGFNVTCDGFGDNLLVPEKFRIVGTGCFDPADFGWIRASGIVLDADGNPVAGVPILSNTTDPNGTSYTYATIATSGADGKWSGRGRLEIELSPTPTFFVQFYATGYTTSPPKHYDPIEPPLAGVDFAP